MMQAVSWLGAASPVWLSLCLIAGFAALAWQLHRTIRRINLHAKSIAHMDEWADVVDQSLKQIDDRIRRASAPPPGPALQKPAAVPASAAAAQRALAELKSRWQK